MQRPQDKNESEKLASSSCSNIPGTLQSKPGLSEQRNKDGRSSFCSRVFSVLFCFVLFFLRFAAAVCKRRRLQPVTTKQPPLLSFVAVNVLQCFQLFNQGLVLVFQHSHAVFQTFDVLFLFPAALASCLPGEGKRKKRKKGERCLSRLMKTFLHPGPQTKCELCTIQREQMFSRLSGLKVLSVNCFHV